MMLSLIKVRTHLLFHQGTCQMARH